MENLISIKMNILTAIQVYVSFSVLFFTSSFFLLPNKAKYK